MKRRLLLGSAMFVACTAPTSLTALRPPPTPYVVPQPPPPPALMAFVQAANPKLPKEEADRIARLVEAVASEYNIEVSLFAAIVRQESTFRSGVKACQNLMGRRTCDYGLAQVNSFWVDQLELDAYRLRTDDLYNLRIAAKILKDVLERHPEKLGYSFYNTADFELRHVYSRHIEKYRRQVVLAMN